MTAHLTRLRQDGDDVTATCDACGWTVTGYVDEVQEAAIGHETSPPQEAVALTQRDTEPARAPASSSEEEADGPLLESLRRLTTEWERAEARFESERRELIVGAMAAGLPRRAIARAAGVSERRLYQVRDEAK